jgi:hypothetical protein
MEGKKDKIERKRGKKKKERGLKASLKFRCGEQTTTRVLGGASELVVDRGCVVVDTDEMTAPSSR